MIKINYYRTIIQLMAFCVNLLNSTKYLPNSPTMQDQTPKYTIADTTAPLDHIAKNGYYVVGDKIFNHRIIALQYATKTKLPVSWNFHNEAYSKINWKERANIPLTELCRLRALQLRQKYDYLILLWSGGGDSTTMLDSFLNNNIRLDEIIIMWPRSKTQGKYTPTQNTVNTNVLSEWDFAIEPKLKKIMADHPSIKITISDTLENPDPNEYYDDTVLIVQKHNYGAIQRWRALDKIIRERTDVYHNVATVLGVSPPEVAIIDDYLAVFFVDSAAYPGSKSDYTLQGWPRNIEYFYTTPDMPELPREQGHVIYDYFKANPAAIKYCPHHLTMGKNLILKKIDRIDSPDTAAWRHFRKFMLYPNYDLKTFQADKPLDNYTNSEWFRWFTDNPHAEEFLPAWRSAIRAHQALIDPKFFRYKDDGSILGYFNFQTKFYIIGKLNHTTRL